MFTPPPSPLPSKARDPSSAQSSSSTEPQKSIMAQEEYLRSVKEKQRTARRFRRAAIFVPIVIIGFTLCTSYLSHANLISLHGSQRQWQTFFEDTSLSLVHKREPLPQDRSSSSVTSSPSSTSSTPSASLTSQTNQPLPTIPASPPVLPPFPQAFDGNLQQNFSSASCLSFFTNMTASPSFRSCRPFSLLLESSSVFINVSHHSILTIIISPLPRFFCSC